MKSSGLSDGELVVLDAAKHFVFDLEEIPRIEELVFSKDCGADLLGLGVEESLVFENRGLREGHDRLGVCMYILLCRSKMSCQAIELRIIRFIPTFMAYIRLTQELQALNMGIISLTSKMVGAICLARETTLKFPDPIDFVRRTGLEENDFRAGDL